MSKSPENHISRRAFFHRVGTTFIAAGLVGMGAGFADSVIHHQRN